ncbi:hypothetical protein ALC56_04979 [Trachymyrmex septentrionalis]|uniref:Uncharacterized protein n=1 Tax=Trachymyrmex septentrionalis TaxID=34720 RepID=A0A195FJ30_9HYME|nr:hypothetical protein ALC56_04979 [Trachymyrmex septentrionalis]
MNRHASNWMTKDAFIVGGLWEIVLRERRWAKERWLIVVGGSPLMKGDDGVMGGVSERCGVGDGDGGGGSDDRCGGDDWASLQDRRGVGERSGGH